MGSAEATLVQIATDEDVEALIARLPAMGHGQHVVVSVQDDSSILLTAAEFSRILTAARAARVGLAISTNDHLRRELARMLGWSVADRPTQVPPRPADLADAEHPEHAEQAEHPEQHTTADIATYIPVELPPYAAAGSGPHRTQTGTVVLDPTAAAAAAVERQQRTTPSAYWRPSPPPEEEQSAPPSQPARRAEVRGRRLAIAAAVVAPLVVLGVVAWLLYYLLPTATVTLVPQQRAIAANLTYGVQLPGNNVDIALPPTTLTATVTFDRSIPTTGERFVPDGTAGGTILLTNPTTQPINVPAQTQLKGTNGMVYLTQQTATVPPADPYNSLAIGSVTVQVLAQYPGADGNAAPSVVLGQLPNGAFFNNRAALTGGSRKRIAVISPADTAALTVAAQQQFASQLDAALQKQITGSLKMVPGSEQKQQMTITFDHPAGTDATTVTGHATRTATALVYDPTKLAAAARDEVGRRLAAQAGGQLVLLAPTVKVDNPTPTNADQTAFSIHASGTVRAVITDQERTQLANQLVGKSLTEANAIVGQMSDVGGYRIDEGPSWLPRQMPQLVSRIRVVVSDGGQANVNP